MSKRRGPITLIVELLRSHPEMIGLGVLFLVSAGFLLFQTLGIRLAADSVY